MFGNLSSYEKRTKIILNIFFTIDLKLRTPFCKNSFLKQKKKKNQITKTQFARSTSFSFLCITGYVYTSYYCTKLQGQKIYTFCLPLPGFWSSNRLCLNWILKGSLRGQCIIVPEGSKYLNLKNLI